MRRNQLPTADFPLTSELILEMAKENAEGKWPYPRRYAVGLLLFLFCCLLRRQVNSPPSTS